MKRFSFFIFIIFLSTGVIHAQSWFELGYGNSGINANGNIYTLCADDSNNIYAAGVFYDTPSFPGYQYVAKWSVQTKSWSHLGEGINGINANNPIHTLCVDKHYHVYAAGGFTTGAFYPYGTRYVSRWDGASWAPLGTGSSGLNRPGVIFSICTDDSDNVYAVGTLTDDASNYYVAKWDAAAGAWGAVGSLNANDYITSVCVDRSGNVYAAGKFADSAGHVYVAKYSSVTNTWSELGTGFDSGASVEVIISSMFADSTGSIYVSGHFGHAGSGTIFSNVFKWDGASWSQLGNLDGNGEILSICKGDRGSVYAAGTFSNASGAAYVAKYDPTTNAWSELGGVNAFNPHTSEPKVYIYSVCTDRNNYVYAGGNFMNSAGRFYVASYGMPYLAAGDLKAVHGISVYPNPATNEICIRADRMLLNNSYSIYDCAGKVVICGRLDILGITKVSLRDVANGEYFLEVDGQLASFKIIKL